jgi:TPR repeat protein
MATLGVVAAFLGTGRYEAVPVAETNASDVQAVAEGLKRGCPAADQGDGEALFHLGCYYSLGIGVIQDDAQAVKLFRQAAEHGNVNAQYCLGVRYRQGLGVARDEAEGLMWIRQAAEHGDAKAKEILRELGG